MSTMINKFIILGFFFIFCNGSNENVTEIELKDPKKDIFPPIKFGIEMKITQTKDVADTNNAICPSSLPFLCETDAEIRCLTHEHLKADIKQNVIVNNLLPNNKLVNKELQCRKAENQINLERSEIHLIMNAPEFSNTPFGENEVQCILIGDVYNDQTNSENEIIQYFKVERNNGKRVAKYNTRSKSEALKIKNKIITPYFKNAVKDQVSLKFFSCEQTKQGIEDAKVWYQNQFIKQKMKPWYMQCEVWIVTAVIIIIGLVLRCVYRCYGDDNAAHEELSNQDSDEPSEYNPSTSNFVIDISELKSLQSLETTSQSQKFSITVTPETLQSLTISHEKHPSQSESQISSQSPTSDEQESEEQKLSKSTELRESKELTHSKSETNTIQMPNTKQKKVSQSVQKASKKKEKKEKKKKNEIPEVVQ